MASAEKVQEYLVASEADNMIDLVRNSVLRNLGETLQELEEKLSEKEFEAVKHYFFTIAKKSGEAGVRLAVDAIAKDFSDEELDELIEIQLRPVTVRLRNLMQELLQQMSGIVNPIVEEALEKLQAALNELHEQEDAERLLTLKDRLSLN
ncbi:hypothetical protein KJ885_03770 [Patescibacteria group bacterium]|nr:hypothetical protein [Patescibacteria group bacterium]